MSQVEPVRKQVIVEASQDRAFHVFTEGIDRWWPREHHIGKTPLLRTVLEPRDGGRWYSVHTDGSECTIGKVIIWEPPERLVLAWQITAGWQYDAELVTEVGVTFSSLGPKRTRVDLEHRDLERYGAAAEAVRKSIGSPGGWSRIMEDFATSAGEEAAA